MNTIFQRAIFGLVMCFATSLATDAAEPVETRAVVIEEIRNEKPQFLVRINVDHPSRLYRVGDTMGVTVTSEKSGYLYVVYVDAMGTSSLLFPNKYQTDNRIQARNAVAVPASGDKFRLRVKEPVGKELIGAIVTQEPLESAKLLAAKEAFGLEVNAKDLRAIFVEGKDESGGERAEHVIQITTTKVNPEQGTVRKVKRTALCIGISEFKDPRVSNLGVCHKDAIAFAQTLRGRGGFTEVEVLTDQDATIANVRSAIRRLVDRTRPQDEVVIFWSGHGDSMADTGGDERDGRDEFLVPHDYDTSTPTTKNETAFTDDEFGRLVQDLDNRRLVVIIDTCCSGGMATNEKVLQKGITSTFSTVEEAADGFDFMGDLVKRTKDIGQTETAVLTASSKDQISYVRRQGDMSVMTFALLEVVNETAGAMPLSLPDIHGRMAAKVDTYIRHNFPNSRQTCTLVNEMQSPFYLVE